MAFSAFDFTKGIDFTALSEGAAGDHNTLVDAATPKTDTATEGKSIVLWSVDGALDTPTVPSAVAVTKWVNYMWLRKPHASAADTTPLLYFWDVNKASDPTYLKWSRVTIDETNLQTQINDILADLSGIEADVANALAIAANAVNTANTALSTANDAAATAANADANATTALTRADEAITDATNAETAANGAVTVSNNAITIANAASAAVPKAYITVNADGYNIASNIPYDNTKPQSNEGTEIASLVLVPRAAGYRLFIRATVAVVVDTDARGVIALFKNNDADATAMGVLTELTEDGPNMIVLECVIVTFDTNPLTLRLRAGADSSTMQVGSAIAKYDGLMQTVLSAIEYPPQA